MIDIRLALVIDLSAVALCFIGLLRWGNISFMHPAVPYFVFHLWCTTQRLLQFVLGSPPSVLFARQPLQEGEIVRASLLFDLTLFLMTLAWILAAWLDRRRNGPLPAPGREAPPNLSGKYLLGVVAVILPLGIVGRLQAAARAPSMLVHQAHQRGPVGWDQSFATTMIQDWMGLALMALIYWYGFQKRLVLLFAVYAAAIVSLGDSRFLLVLPLIFIAYVYLTRHGRRWPDARIAAALLLGAVLWLPGRAVGRAVMSGQNVAAVVHTGLHVWGTATSRSDDPDTQFLDMAAATLALVDQKGKFYYGETITPLFFIWIPRPLWPDKPEHNEYMYDLSTPRRDLAHMTMTTSLMGDSYVNFGYVGIVLVPFLFAFLLGCAYFAAFRSHYYSIGRFTYLVVACSLIQPYRDGLYSFFTFNLFIMMPFVVLGLLHYVFPTVRRTPCPVVTDPPG